MPADPDGEDMAEPLLDEDILDRSLGEIEDTLRSGFESDARLGHGASGDTPNDELDFIQMTGLTRPEPATDGDAPQTAPLKDDALSFYEPGVRDVDHAMNPADAETLGPKAVEAESTDSAQEAAAGFRSIADELADNKATPIAADPTSPPVEPAVAPKAETEVEATAPENPDLLPTPASDPAADVAVPVRTEDPTTANLEALLAEFEDESPTRTPESLDEPADVVDAYLDVERDNSDLPPQTASNTVDHTADDELDSMLDALSSAHPVETPQASEATALTEIEEDVLPETRRPTEDAWAETPTPETPSAETLPPVAEDENLFLDATPIVPELSDGAEDDFVRAPDASTSADDKEDDGGMDEMLASAAWLHEARRKPESPAAVNPKLAEAEQLLQALEDIPSPVPAAASGPDNKNASAAPAKPETKRTGMATEESNAQVVYDYTAAPVKRRSKSLSRRRNRVLRRIALAIIALLIVGGVSLAAAWWIYPRLQSADDLYTVAQSQLAEGRYERASLSFGQFARQNPTHIRGIDAQFESAWVLTLVDSPPADVATRLNEEALEKFQAFIEAHPSDEKCARAETLIGRLQYELGNYPAAIEMLRDPVRQLRDPDGALPVLRTLARAYGKTGAIDDARSTYLQAASLASNVTPEVDYYELGELLRVHADAAPEKEVLIDEARRYWQMAVEAPSIDPSHRDEIISNIAWLEIGETGPPLEDAAPVATPTAAPVPTAPEEAPATAWEADPAEAAEHAAQAAATNEEVSP